MGLAIDTVLLDVHNAATTAIGLTNATAATGDQLAVRSFDPPAYCKLENVYVQGATPPRRFRLLSPRLHDNVTGISFDALESPTEFLLPGYGIQNLYSADTLVPQMDAAGSSDTVAALFNYYSDLKGVAADLRSWDQIKASIVNIKPIEVDVTTNATIGAWSDTVITTTENQLKADYSYALLGVGESAVVLAVGIKGPATGNMRICAPGASPTLKLSEYFVYMDRQTGTPHIPVFKANDRGATFVSVASNAASVATNVFLILAQLAI